MAVASGKLQGVLPNGIKWEYEGELTAEAVKHGKGVETFADDAMYTGE